MKTTSLLANYTQWSRQDLNQESGKDLSSQWKKENPSFEQNLIQSLFVDLPRLEEFSFTLINAGNHFVTVNHTLSLINVYSFSPEFKSWLVEVNLKGFEFSLMLRCLPFFSKPQGDLILSFKRKEILP